MKPLLTLGILTLPARCNQLNRLLNQLRGQIMADAFDDQVEILVESDNGERRRGQKRQDVVDKATGEFFAFIDDDDLVSDTYVKQIMAAITKHQFIDCVGFKGVLRRKDPPEEVFVHSIRYDRWFSRNGMHFRCPNHLNPIRLRHVRAVGYDVARHDDEDSDFSKRMQKAGLLRREHFIDDCLYLYYPGAWLTA